MARSAARAGIAGTLVLAAAVVARSELVDRIVAVVGEEPILLSEVDEEVYLARLRSDLDLADSAAVAELRAEVLESKIEERILVEKARTEGIQVSREEVDEAVDRMVADIRGRFRTEEAFQEQLAQEGMNLADLTRLYRPRVEEQMLVRQLMDRLVRSRVSVEERDIRKYWEENSASIAQVPAALELRRILVSLGSTGAVDSAAVERAEIVRRRLESGEDFATLASVFSEGPTAAKGGDIGWFRAADLEPRLAEAVEGLAPGDVSEVLVTDRGAHILQVAERRGKDEVRLRQIIFLRDEEAARASARARAESIRSRLEGGADFAELAEAESDDPVTRGAGGYLGSVPVEALAPSFRTQLESLSEDEVSAIIEDEEGFSIFRLDGREGERAASFEDVHDRIAELLQQQRAQEIYQEVLAEARASTFVENRLAAGS
ncbi:MAG: peptidylprolyl isomerase [Candidatus Eiseniibacteriota bacterium]